MKLSSLLAPLIAAKVPHDQIMAVIVAFEAEQGNALERRRQADADRQARKRSRDVTLRHSDRSLTGGGARVEDKTLTSEIEPQESKKEQNAPKRDDVSAFRTDLATDLPSDLLEAFISVRRKKRGALSGYAAKLFRGDAAKCDMSVFAAAEECVRSSWITVKPEYFQGRPRAGPVQLKTNSVRDVIANLSKEMEAANAGSAAQDEGYRPALVGISYRQHG